MAWNSTSNKSLGGNRSSKAAVPYGAPVTTNLGTNSGRGYHDAWDVERAYREGIKKVTWVARSIDAIAGNQARLPMQVRKDNSPYGTIVNDEDTLRILNSQSNPGENSFIFRYRLSSQLLISTRGAFVEKIRGRDGRITALHLLPPQHTSPIPDPKTFVKGYEVSLPGGGKQFVKPEDVLWFRHPHPLDPYLSMTPMEAAGIAIEIENLSKFYNRNFLLNDGRPGGLLVVRGDMDEEDKDELRSRFRGNVAQAGAVTVLASEDGIDFVDTAANPRDAAYVEMRRITKEEILAAFGVPESVIGNAANRTFSNAGEEVKVFWMETMIPHLEMLARGFDGLDDKHYFDFDTTGVPILILAKQEREQYLLSEFQGGLITANEYRKATGREAVLSDLADTMLANPNLAPIGNTARDMPFVDPAAQPAGGMPPGPGMPPGGAAMPGQPEQAAEQPPQPVTTTGDPNAAMLAQGAAPPSPEAVAAAEEAGFQVQTASLHVPGIEAKTALGDWETKAANSTVRWESIFDKTLERFFDRQQRVVTEKARGAKAQKALTERKLTVDALFDDASWDRQIEEDFHPIVSGMVREAAEMVEEKTSHKVDASASQYDEIIDAQVQRIKQMNQTTKDEIAAAVFTAQQLEEEEDSHGLLLATIAAVFVKALSKRRQTAARNEAQSAFNGGFYLAGLETGLGKKVWLTELDERVRPEHRILHGKSVGMDEGFDVEGSMLRYPGDPLAPSHLSIGCRCKLRFD